MAFGLPVSHGMTAFVVVPLLAPSPSPACGLPGRALRDPQIARSASRARVPRIARSAPITSVNSRLDPTDNGDGRDADAIPAQSQSSPLSIIPDARNNRSLWALASIGFLWTVSNLMVVAILPIYMKTELGLSSTKIGALEGAAIAAAFFSKIFSGLASDAIGSRIGVIALGAAMTAMVKPMFAAAGSVNALWGGLIAFQWIFAAKIIDRLSKGVRAAPTDALLADLSPGEARNRAYSLNQSLATMGGFMGSVACSAAMFVTGNNYEITFAMATIPAALAIIVLLLFVKQPDLNAQSGATTGIKSEEKKKPKTSLWKGVASLSPRFYCSAFVVSVLYMSRFSESFVMLRAKSVGTPLTLIPLLATANQVAQALLTYPMGYIADKFDSRIVMAVGFAMMIAAQVTFFSVPSSLGSIAGFVLAGIHMSMTQANSKSMISQNLSPTQRGTGFAVFSVISGVTLAAGNIMAGYLNDISVKRGLGMVGCFYGGAFWSSLSLALLLVYYAIFRNEDTKKEKGRSNGLQ